ncbi:MAG: TonB-dependent receptor [Bacteroidales bacterium]|nr:TonB-dependent receptor [Bacteroidales bacterium]
MKKNKPYGEMLLFSQRKLLLIMRCVAFLVITGMLQAYTIDTSISESNSSDSEFEKFFKTERKAGIDVNSVQQQTLTGRITSTENGDPMPGVNVQIKGTTIGTISDVSGRYSLTNVDGNATLVFSFIGYTTREIAVEGRPVIDVALSPELLGLEEVVVVGYGSQRREEITSSIVSVKEDNFVKGAIISSPLQMVQGKVAGLSISRASGGDPTAGVQMQLRGVSTVRGDASPLVIIDGIPGGSLNTLSPEDIESINILRDGSAAAIYGTRGNAGVIIITTKQGSAGKPEVNYATYFYTETWLKKPELLDAQGWRDLKTQFQNSPSALLRSKANSIVDFGHDTDWLDEITRNTISQVHNLSISGGSQNTTYYGSVNFRNLNGFIKNSNNQIINGRLSVSHTGLDDRLNVQMSLSNTFSTESPVDYQSYRQAMQWNPTMSVYNEDGTFTEIVAYDTSNPVGLLEQYDRQYKRTLLLGNIQTSYRITKSLKLSATGALQKSDNLYGYYQHNDAWGAIQGGTNGTAQRTVSESFDRTFEASLNYTNQFMRVHTINGLLGYSYQDFTNENFGARNRDFLSNVFGFNNLGAGLQVPDGKYTSGDITSYKSTHKLVAFFARLNYNYSQKYMLSASVRQEGSSRFGANNKWGLFPAVSGGWTISRESFMGNISFINELKLRAGWGVTGNQGIGSYYSLERLGTSGVMLYQGVWIPGYAPSSNPNPDLRWEKKSETNIGIDASFLNHSLNLTIDLYQRNTKDLLYEYSVPVPPNLYSTTWLNVGKMRNQGIEFSINANPVKKSNFSWNLDFNISYNINELLSLSNDQYQTKYTDLTNIGAPGLNDTPAFRLEEGQPIGNFYGYQFAEVADDGTWRFWNKDHDALLTAAEVKMEDKAILGNGLPKSSLGFTNAFQFKNFDVSIFFRGALGFEILNTQRLFYENPVMTPLNVLKSTLKTPVIADPQYSDYYIEKGDYLKLDNLTFGYTIPLKGIQNLRVYAVGQNLLCFTSYKGQDPEIGISGLSPGIDYRWQYPAVRTFTMGLNVKF